ncbi:MAG TPA: hypothetical protein VHV74_06035, partial [Pseudonocardiaceae bacterium]|nr:hypothetical protein [Pseudonocardiaceae bacterium]
MPDQPVATPQADTPVGRFAMARGALGSRAVRYGFVVVAVGLGVYAVVRQWPDVRTSLVQIGVLPAIGALVAAVAGLGFAVQVWRVLLAALGTPLPLRASAKVVFVGQLGKYLPGSVWPVLAQMELGTT